MLMIGLDLSSSSEKSKKFQNLEVDKIEKLHKPRKLLTPN